MSSKRLIILFSESKFDYKAINCHKAAADIWVTTNSFTKEINQEFITELESKVESGEINEISLEMTTTNKNEVSRSESEAEFVLIDELSALINTPVLANYIALGKLKAVGFVYNNATGLYAEVDISSLIARH